MESKQSPKLTLLAQATLCCAGIGIFAWGYTQRELNLEFATNGKLAMATVTLSGSLRSTANTSYAEYEFQLPTGEVVRGSQTGYASKVGEKVLVQYVKDKPSRNRFAGSEKKREGWILPAMVLGPIVLLGGLFSLIRHPSQGKKVQP